MKKNLVWRIGIGGLVVAAALTFQNCGPTFVTDEMGQVQMSSFEGPIVIPKNVPSQALGRFPSTGRGNFAKGSAATNPGDFNLCDSIRPTNGVARCADSAINIGQ